MYEVSRSGYYKWLKRKGTLNRYEQQQQELDYYVADVHSHYPSQGYRSIADTLLNQYGWVVSDVSVFKSMKRLGISGFIRKQKSSEQGGSGNEHNRFPNILNRDFYSDKPMQKIVTDVTYIKNKGKWYYLACYLDLFNNEIVDWELSDVFDNFLVMKPAKRILEKAKSTGTPILLHSDQGSQYSSAGYCNLLKSYNTIQSMSRAGTPRDNAVMESFLDDLRTLCHRTSNIGSAMTYTKRLQIPFITSIMFVLFENLKENRQSNTGLNWQLKLFRFLCLLTIDYFNLIPRFYF